MSTIDKSKNASIDADLTTQLETCTVKSNLEHNLGMIDVLMSTYNGSLFIREQIESILGQSFSDFRLMIRDDGSQDDTVSIIEEYVLKDPRLKIVQDTDGNLGLRRSFMRLVEASASDHFMFADQDDVWLPDKMSRSFERISELASRYGDDTPILVFTDLSVVDDELAEIDRSFWHYQSLDPEIATDWKKLLAQNVVTGCTIIANRAAAMVSLPFAMPEMMHDHWLAVNTARSGKIDFIKDQTVLYRQHQDNAEGGKNFGITYALSKIPAIINNRSFYERAATHFGSVSASGLMVRKMCLNFGRFYDRSQQ